MRKESRQELLARLEALAVSSRWCGVEKGHAVDALDSNYGEEFVVALASGRELRTPPSGQDCSYVRVVEQGFELMYWSAEEWQRDPSVLGAILGLAGESPTSAPRFFAV